MRAATLFAILGAFLALTCAVALAKPSLSSSASSVRTSSSRSVSSSQGSRWRPRSSSSRSFSFSRRSNSWPRRSSSSSRSSPWRSKRSRSRRSSRNGDKSYGFYVLATSWIGSVCQFKKCNLLTSRNEENYKRFNLHGLWPSQTPSAGPQDCSIERFSFEALPSNLRDELSVKWSGLYSSTQTFLNHEWSKHGTCWNPSQSSSVPTSGSRSTSTSASSSTSSSSSASKMAAYFWKSIELADRYNMYKLLANSGITPRDDQPYDISAIKNAVKKVTGTDQFNIMCQSRNGQPYLYEVRMCLDLQYKPIACQRPRDNCNGRALYPKFVLK